MVSSTKPTGSFIVGLTAVLAPMVTAQAPSPRIGHVMTSAGPTGGVLLWGGARGGNVPRLIDSLWLWDGANWRVLSDAGPRSRVMPAAAYDTRRGVLVVYGGTGIDNGTRYGDTWEWDGRAWTEANVRTPGPRDHHAMAYDEARATVVMYGGATRTGELPNDTWTWDGAVWTLADTTTGPGGLVHHAMVYDSRRQRIVLVGGNGPGDRTSPDVWEWDGHRWVRIPVEGGPGPRSRHRMAYDPVRGVTVLSGGQIGIGKTSTYPIDTWTWDGRAWTLAGSSPPPRYVSAMAYDVARRTIVLFGGGATATPWGPLGDLWEWDGARWERR